MKFSSRPPLRTRWIGLSLITIALCAGCRSNTAQLQQDYVKQLREQEDQIYLLEDYLTEYQQIIRNQRAENAALKAKISGKSGKTTTSGADAGQDTMIPGTSPGVTKPLDTDTPFKDDPAGESTNGPAIDLGEPGLPNIDLGEPTTSEGIDAPAPLDDSSDARRLDSQGVARVSAPPAEPADSVAVYAEQVPTEAAGEVQVGMLAIIEPLCRDGRAGTFAGTLSLMVVDPVAADGENELARWDLAPDEVATAWRDTSCRVLDFALALPDNAPVGRPLELWVRLEPEEGEAKILSHTMIELAPAAQMAGLAASGMPRRPADGDAVQSSWTAAAMPDQPLAEAKSDWRAASTPPPAALAPPAELALRPRAAAELRAPTWAPKR